MFVSAVAGEGPQGMVFGMRTWESRSDAELVEAYAQGEMEAFAELYRRHRDWTTRLALRFTGNPEEAVEVMQEAFAHLLSRFPGFTLRAKLTTYLYPVVRSIAVSRGRKRRRERGAPSGDPEGVGTGDPVIGDVELARAVGELPEGQREVLLMRVVHEMRPDEVAAALDIPVGTVKSRLHSALGALRRDSRTRGYFEGFSP